MRNTEAPKLLIVDDEARQVEALANTLGRENYYVVGVTNGAAALEELQRTQFSLLLTDLSMPDMDGIGLLRAAQKIDPDLVCVMMTGHGTVDAAVEAMKAGALDFIVKPFKLSSIMPVLSRAQYVRELRIANARLLRQVSDQVAALEVANKKLEATNQELDAFSYSVSHDLRAPLRSIIGFAHLLQESHASQLSGEAERFLASIVGSAERMRRLIDDLLRFAHLGRQQLRLQPVELQTLATQIVDELRTTYSDSKTEVIIGELPEVRGDAPLLKQALLNLLSNAFKFTRHKERPSIEIGCERRDDGPVYFVRDNGAGFDMRYAAKLFGVFQRLHSNTEFEGTGVGLSLVRRIIERHGGRIWAESMPERGATFYFTLATTGMFPAPTATTAA